MIISRTPFRVSLFGGGTDYPQWYLENGGTVIGTAIDKYCYISLRHLPPFFEHRHRIVYSVVETPNSIEEIRHPAVKAVLTEMEVNTGLELHHDGDLPARSGLGSSSSFTVGLINALSALRGKITSKKELALEAIRIEQEVIAEHVGSQDQIWAAYGGMNRINFNQDGSFNVNPIIGKQRGQELVAHLMLFFTGISRFASEIAKEKIANLGERKANLREMALMVDEAEKILVADQGTLADIGRLLHEGWRLKKELAASVTNTVVDDIYAAGMEAGATGGKLLGAGGGGFILFFVDPEKQSRVRQRLKDLIDVRFGIDRSGSTIVVYEPDGLENV